MSQSAIAVIRFLRRSAMFSMLTLALFGATVSHAQSDDAPDTADMALLVEDQVNINTADADTLALALDGVGMTRALDIIAYREEHGAFEQVDHLERVRGIGKATLERNRHKIRLSSDGE